MKGRCLCGEVAFELQEPVPNLYQCHCSLCRRVTGSAANAALRIPAAQFAWLAGREQIA
ncbi:MAG: GFA family protein, partial [Gammaproteobacteria bacterium]